MKKIILEIEDDVLDQVETQLTLKMMMGNLHGAEDVFCAIIIKSIKDGKEQIRIAKKGRKEKKGRKKK